MTMQKNIWGDMSFKVITMLFCVILIKSQEDSPYLILISFDGFRYDYMNRAETKSFDFIAEYGVKATSLIPVFPSKTFSNHYSIVTGMYPEHHGIINNNFYDKKYKEYYRSREQKKVTDPKWYNGIPIWELLERNGIKTASFYWIGSEAKINGIQPTYFYQYNHYYPNKDRINQVIDWLNLPEKERPHFITLYFPILDDAGHIYGPEAKEMIDVIKQADSYIGYLISQVNKLTIAKDVNIIIVSDHGMTSTEEKDAILLTDFLDITPSQIVADKPFQMMFFDDKNKESKAYDTLSQLDHIQIFRKDNIPLNYHFQHRDRTPDLLLLADEGFSLCYKPVKISKGNHGYSPSIKNMHGIFLAYGNSFKQNFRIDSFENIHIYPLISELFKIPYAHQIDGNLNVLKSILVSD